MSQRSMLKTLLGHSGIYLFALVVSQGLPLFLLPLITRYLTPSQWGAVALAETVGYLVGVAALLGLQTALQRLWFDVTEDERPTLLQAVTRSGVLSALLTLGLSLSVGMWVFDTFASGFSVSFYPLIALGIVAGVARELSRLKLVSWQVQHHSRRWATFALVVAVLTVAGVVVGVVVLQREALGYLSGRTAAELIGVVAAVGMLWRRTPGEVRLRPWMSRALRLGAPLVPYQIAAYTLIGADRFFLEHYWSLDEVGTYAVAYSLAGGLTFAGGALLTAWSPRFFELANQDKRRWLADRTRTLMGLLAAAMIVGSVLAEPVVSWALGAKYADVGLLVPWIAIGTLLHAWYGFVQLPILFEDRTGLFVVITGFALVVNLALNWMLVPSMGPTGAALATAFAYAVEVFLAWWLAQRIWPLPLSLPSVIALSVVSIGVGLLVPWLRGHEGRIWLLMTATVVGLSIVYRAARPRVTDADSGENGASGPPLATNQETEQP